MDPDETNSDESLFPSFGTPSSPIVIPSNSESDSDEEPPRRRIRIDHQSIPPDLLVLRDCRVHVPRVNETDLLPFQAPRSSSTNGITTRAATAAAATAALAAAVAARATAAAVAARATAAAVSATALFASSVFHHGGLGIRSSSDPGSGSIINTTNTISVSSDSDLDLSLSELQAGNISIASSTLSSDADSEFARNWLHRRLVRRNAIFLDEDNEEEEEEFDHDEDDEDLDALFDEEDDEVGSDVEIVHDDSDATNDNDATDDNDATNDNNTGSNSTSNDSRGEDVDTSLRISNILIRANLPGTSQLTSDSSDEPIAGPSRKLNETVRSTADDDEGLTCLICYEQFTNSGEHRISCLKCGHTYGKACIEKWIKNERRCPQCNAKAVRKDIRVLYVKNLKALDTVERDKLLVDLEKEKESKRKLELECSRLRQNNLCRDLDFSRLNNEVKNLRDRIGGIYRDPVSSSEMISSTSSGSRRFVQTKYFEFKEGEFRVGAYNQWHNMTAISQTLKNALYPQGCYGIKRINMLDLKTLNTTPIHQKEIRDLQFNPQQNDLLLSVGMDKKALLTNNQNNVIVQTFNTTQPLWSCTWNSMNEYLFYVGTSSGQIVSYDVRSPQEAVKILTIPTIDTTPIARMHFVTPSYQNPKRAFTLSGLLIQKLSSCWFCEIKNEKATFHQLPLEGSFSSLDFEPTSRHILVSTRPNSKHPVGRHLVSELSQYFSDAQECNICSCNVVQTFEGGAIGLGKMSRSSIFSPVDGTVFIGANAGQNVVNLWNVSDVNMKQTLQIRDPILDFVPCQVNDNFLLNMISSNGLHVYKNL